MSENLGPRTPEASMNENYEGLDRSASDTTIIAPRPSSLPVLSPQVDDSRPSSLASQLEACKAVPLDLLHSDSRLRFLKLH